MSLDLDLDAGWRLHPQVALRPEPFGALLYHFGTRRLSFLKDPVLRDLVEGLAQAPSLRSRCAEVGLGADVPAPVRAALGTLAATDMIVRR
jgi:putative mycofactocin binding protein MftB